ncbi:hypothetical protein [Amycolatopsis sp. WAC 04197]|uniref:hypothetical protein n=1 Tax=Amycolatopsis sp. WAC 04197 TaxID=2203199 RepID=UPI001F3B690E|nr:hypothetical protein [Amycolatopsis sp. WAC 04197]
MTIRAKTGFDVKALAAVAVTMFLWASAFVGIRFAGAHYEPGSLALGSCWWARSPWA